MSKCLQWSRSPTINPHTGRKIKVNGPTFKKLQLECGGGSGGECEKWLKNPLANPATGRSIKKNGPTFATLQRKCSSNITPSFLDKFVDAQNKNRSYENAVLEMKRGKKTGHWIWYVFPQLAALGKSPTSQYYGLSSIEEALDYLNHPILGQRYIECLSILINLRGKSIGDVFSADSIKVHSSMTLFYLADPENELLNQSLNKYFHGNLDKMTEYLV